MCRVGAYLPSPLLLGGLHVCACVSHSLVCKCGVGAYPLSPLGLRAWGVCVRWVGCACARLVSREGWQGRARQGQSQGQGALINMARQLRLQASAKPTGKPSSLSSCFACKKRSSLCIISRESSELGGRI